MLAMTLVEKGLVPDSIVRAGIRRLCRQRLSEEHSDNPELQEQRYQSLLSGLRESKIAIETEAANEQHYEVPTEFYRLALGENLKYSACYWESNINTLEDAENSSLQLSASRAELIDGQDILELGCGWGSFTLWMAANFPNSTITAVSNSATQKLHIDAQAKARNLSNIEVITQDVNQLQLNRQFDRVVSIEMFEHMRNYQLLFERVSNWLKPEGKLWVHVFCHRYLMYPFEVDGDDNWMGKYFFTGGLMPAADTFFNFQDHLKCEQRWLMPGTHYQKTAEGWLANLDKNKARVKELFEEAYGQDKADLWVYRWRLFFLSCAELFGYRDGNEWLVGHYRFHKKS